MKNEVMSLIGNLICFLDGQRERRNLLDNPLLAAENKLWDQLFHLRNEFLERYLC